MADHRSRFDLFAGHDSLVLFISRPVNTIHENARGQCRLVHVEVKPPALVAFNRDTVGFSAARALELDPVPARICINKLQGASICELSWPSASCGAAVLVTA